MRAGRARAVLKVSDFFKTGGAARRHAVRHGDD